MLPQPTDLYYFLEVAETQNISRAAERLGVTQPTLSASLQRLEQNLNAQVFLRGRTGVQLTPSGKLLLHRCRDLLRNWTQLQSDVSKNNEGIAGQFVIGAHVSVALYSLHHFLPELLKKYAELQLNIVHGLSRQITEKVISFEVDFGIVVNRVTHPDLVITELCRDEVTFWKSKNSQENLDVLIYDPGLMQNQKLLADARKMMLPFQRSLHSSSLEVISDLAATGCGVALLPTRVAQLRPELKLYTKGSKPISVFKDRICLVYRADYQKSKAAQVIIAAIKKAVK